MKTNAGNAEAPEEEANAAEPVDELQEATVAEPGLGLKIKLNLKRIREAQVK
jgi:hypothetical protein